MKIITLVLEGDNLMGTHTDDTSRDDRIGMLQHALGLEIAGQYEVEVDGYNTSEEYSKTLNETRQSRDAAKKNYERVLRELKARKAYEDCLKTIIKNGETLHESQTFDKFCQDRGFDV